METKKKRKTVRKIAIIAAIALILILLPLYFIFSPVTLVFRITGGTGSAHSGRDIHQAAYAVISDNWGPGKTKITLLDYAGDARSSWELSYYNSNLPEKYVDCVVFRAKVHSAYRMPGDKIWPTTREISYVVGKTASGEWVVITKGYP